MGFLRILSTQKLLDLSVLLNAEAAQTQIHKLSLIWRKLQENLISVMKKDKVYAQNMAQKELKKSNENSLV